MTNKQDNVLPDYRLMLLVAAFLLLIYLLLDILSPFLIAAILAYICSPIVNKLSLMGLGKYKVSRTLGALVTLLLLIGVVIAAFLIIVPLLQKELLLVVKRLPAYLDLLRSHLEPWLLQHFDITLDINIGQIQTLLGNNWKSAGNFAGNILASVSNGGLAFVAWMANFLLIPVVLFYFLRDWPNLVAQVAQLFPRRWYDKTAAIASEVDLVLAEFLRGQLSVMLLMSAFYAVGLWFAGLELALPIALVAGMLGFVPYLGITIGTLLAFLSAVLQFTALSQFIPLIIVFGLGQVLESFLLTPWLVGDRIGLHPVVVIFALLAGGQLFGFTGILLALPASAAIAVGLKHAQKAYLLSDYYQ
ncbi:MAG: AI-2E family transporter [Methylophilaceae bacterium]|nr:AI-2E family transporter [Methylophilaceae bacterium]